jgi:hypothetical protein
MHPVVARLTNGVEMDVLGIAYSELSGADREAIVAAYPRTEHFKEDIIQTFHEGIKDKPETTFGNVKARCTGEQGSKVPARVLLQCHPRFAVEGLRKSLSGRSLEPPLHSVQPINFAIRTSESEDS